LPIGRISNFAFRNMTIAINAVSAKMGGAVSYLTNLLRNLPPPESGYRFLVFVRTETARLLGDVAANILICEIPSGDSDGWRRFWWEQITLRRLLQRENIKALFSSANFAMFQCPVRQILLVRNAVYFSKMYQETILPRQAWKKRAWFRLSRRLVCMSARTADLVMTPTQAMLDGLRDYAEVPPHKALVNPYGVEPCNGSGPSPRREEGQEPASGSAEAGSTTPAPSLTRREIVTPSHSPVRLLYVSLYGENKDLSTLLRALPLLNRDAGRGFVLKTTANPHWKEVAQAVTRPEAIALLQSPEIAQRVQFVGPLPRRETQRLYRDADLFVFPSWLESFGQPMAEAMAHGLPIVAADTPLNREICGESAVYFRVGDANDLAEKVRNLCADEALRQKLNASGRARAANNFKWEVHVARLLAVLAPA
jgi:glycosyltransferase involved in cell wall biosynthesis